MGYRILSGPISLLISDAFLHIIVASHLQTQRSAIKMLHDRIQVLVEYVASVVAGMYLIHNLEEHGLFSNSSTPIGSAQKDYDILRSLAALVASLPASESPEFQEEFDAVKVDLVSFRHTGVPDL